MPVFTRRFTIVMTCTHSLQLGAQGVYTAPSCGGREASRRAERYFLTLRCSIGSRSTDLIRCVGVQAGGGLVQEEHPGVGDHGNCDVGALGLQSPKSAFIASVRSLCGHGLQHVNSFPQEPQLASKMQQGVLLSCQNGQSIPCTVCPHYEACHEFTLCPPDHRKSPWPWSCQS